VGKGDLASHSRTPPNRGSRNNKIYSGCGGLTSSHRKVHYQGVEKIFASEGLTKLPEFHAESQKERHCTRRPKGGLPGHYEEEARTRRRTFRKEGDTRSWEPNAKKGERNTLKEREPGYGKKRNRNGDKSCGLILLKRTTRETDQG